MKGCQTQWRIQTADAGGLRTSTTTRFPSAGPLYLFITIKNKKIKKTFVSREASFKGKCKFKVITARPQKKKKKKKEGESSSWTDVSEDCTWFCPSTNHTDYLMG